MRTIKKTRREISDNAIRDSSRSKVMLGYLTTTYDGGSKARISVAEDSLGDFTARIPTFLQPAASIPAGSPVTVRANRGYMEIVSWHTPNPIFYLEKIASIGSYANDALLIIRMDDEFIDRDDLDIWTSQSQPLQLAEGFDGIWSAQCTIKWQAHGTGYRRIWMQVNDVDRAALYNESVTNTGWYQTLSREITLSGEDNVAWYVRHTAGVALTIDELTISLRFLRPA